MGRHRFVRLQKTWDERTDTWHHQVSGSAAFDVVRRETIVACAIGHGDVVVDLGAGTGFVALELAPDASEVVAVDASSEMLRVLARSADDRLLSNVTTRCADLATFDLPPASVDVVVSSYALHHLEDDAKRALVWRTYRWLRPGGRLVIADMMFGRGGSRDDRRILVTKIRRLARRGPKGVWRIAKNLVRFGLRRGTELPVARSFWVDALGNAGFVEVVSRPLVAEAGLVWGRRPDWQAGKSDEQE